MMRKLLKNGFTLTEIIITIVIVGVVAAMTLPTLNKKIQQQITVNRLKQTYAMLQNAIKMAEAEDGDIGSWDFSGVSSVTFEKYLMKHLKLSNKQHMRINGAYGVTYYQISGAKETDLGMMRNDRPGMNGSNKYMLSNGVQLIISNWGSGYIAILADLNGTKKPNKFGIDVFMMNIKPDRGLAFDGLYSTDEYTVPSPNHKDRNFLKRCEYQYKYCCNKAGRGMWCGALIYVDGWKIMPDYPWK